MDQQSCCRIIKQDKEMRRKALLFTLCLAAAALLLCPCIAGAENQDTRGTVYWINPEGGSRYHLDQNCRSVHPKYLPLSFSITEEELEKEPYRQFLPCDVCGSANPGQNGETGSDVLNRIAQLPENPAPALTVEVIRNKVNFRQAPGGKILGQLQGGTELDFLEEAWVQDSLWYHAKSEQYGEGYIQATWAKPVWNGIYYWTRKIDADKTNDDDILTDNMLRFRLGVLQLQFEHGLIRFTDDETDGLFVFDPDLYEADEELSEEPGMKTEYALLLYENGMLCMDDRYDLLRNGEKSAQEKSDIASDVLKKHYGTDNLRVIFRQMNVCGFHPSDWHTPEIPVTTRHDVEALQAVLNEFVRKNRK